MINMKEVKESKLNRGSALVIVLITVSVVSILGITIIGMTWQRMYMTASYRESTQLFYAANAGIEEAKECIDTQIPLCEAEVRRKLDEKLSNEYDPEFDYNNYADITKDNYFKGFFGISGDEKNICFGQLDDNGTKYSVKAFYEEGTDTITVYSTGSFINAKYVAGKEVSTTITAKFKLNNKSEQIPCVEEIRGLPPYPLIVAASGTQTIDNYSLNANCNKLDITGPLYLPRGIESVADFSTSGFNFSDEVIVNDDLKLAAWKKSFTAGNGMKVKGNLVVGSSSKSEVTLNIEKGDLVVDGNIEINGWKSNINVKNGSVRCSGNIIINSSESTLYVSKNLYVKGNIQNTQWMSGVVVNGEVNKDYGGDIKPVEFTLGDKSVFSKSGITQTSKVTSSIGDKNNPVMIYNDGDIDIENVWNTSTIDIYGVIYATGKVNFTGWGLNGGNINVFGVVATGKKMNVDEYSKNVSLVYDKATISNFEKKFPEVVDYFNASQLEESGSVDVEVLSNFSTVFWKE